MLYLLAVSYTFSDRLEGAAAVAAVAVIGIIICVILSLLILPVFIVAAVARRQANKWLNQRMNTVVAQYDAPRGLTPAEAGLLYDMRCDQTEVMATLFHLEQRRIVKIIDSKNVEVIDQSLYGSLPEYEKIAIRIARGETSTIDAPRMLPVTFVDDSGVSRQFNLPLPQQKSLQTFSRAVQQSVVSKGIPMRNYGVGFFKRSLVTALALALWPLLTIALPGMTNGINYEAWTPMAFASAAMTVVVFGFLFWPAYLGTALFFTWLWTRIAGRHWINTRQARAVWPELEGYKLYLNQVEIDNIQFESQEKSGTPVTTALPYAMVFGLETHWQQRLSEKL